MSVNDRLVAGVLPPLGARVIRALGQTLSLTVIGAAPLAPLWREGHPIVYGAWHGQLLMLPFVHERLRRTHAARPVHVLASRSRDGELLARFVQRFGLGVVRGSSSRGGTGALRRLTRHVHTGHDVALAPDGPRGPRERCQPGIVALASVTGAPLVPLAFAASPIWQLQSWDALEIPRPFGRAAVVFGGPLSVTPDDDRDQACRTLETALMEATQEARRAVVARR